MFSCYTWWVSQLIYNVSLVKNLNDNVSKTSIYVEYMYHEEKISSLFVQEKVLFCRITHVHINVLNIQIVICTLQTCKQKCKNLQI